MLCLDEISSVSLVIDASGVAMSTSSLDSSSTNQDIKKLKTIYMQLYPSHESLNDRNSPHRIKWLKFLLKITSPVKICLIIFIIVRSIHFQWQIITKWKIHALLEDSRNIQQNLSLFITQILLFLRIIKKINRLSNLKYISLPNSPNNINLLSQNNNLLLIEIQYANQTAEVMRLIGLVSLFRKRWVLFDVFGLSIDL